MVSIIKKAVADVFSPPLRATLLKSLGLTLLLLVTGWIGLFVLVDYLVRLERAWIESLIEILTAVGLLIAAIFLVVPLTALMAGLFADEIAEALEKTHYGEDLPGRSLPFLVGLREAIGFFAIVVVVNLFAFALLLVPGVNAIIFLLANGYLLGREYFELVAMRHRPKNQVTELRRDHGGKVLLSGLAVALMVAIPLVNLLTPIFATALMVHLHKSLPAPKAPSWQSS
ncbi:MAG: sulfate transporter family protein [Pseudomonadota bacterium]